MYLGTSEGKTKEGCLIRRDDPAFLLIDPEFESTFQEAFQASHDPFSRLAALHQNDEVVGIAGETMATFLKLFRSISTAMR